MIGHGTKKASRYLVILVFLVIAVLVFLRLSLRYRSFEGSIEAVRFEN